MQLNLFQGYSITRLESITNQTGVFLLWDTNAFGRNIKDPSSTHVFHTVMYFRNFCHGT